MASFRPSAWPPPVATSSEETLLVTRTGEVLVCRHHAAADDPNDIINDNNDSTTPPHAHGILKSASSDLLDDCSLNTNSFEASITGRNKLHRQQQRETLQQAWAECCEPDRIMCNSSNQNNTMGNHLSSSSTRGGGLFGGSEEDTANSYNEFVNGMNSRLKMYSDNLQNVIENDWNTVPPKRKKKLQQSAKQGQSTKLKQQQQQPLFQTPPRKGGNRRPKTTDNSLSSTINSFGTNDDDSDDEEEREEEHDENPDRININDVQLQDHNNFPFICGGGGSPTPMLSFDYSWYEPPTPERLLNDDDDGSCTSTEATFSMASTALPPALPSTSTSTKAKVEDNGDGTMTINGHHHQEQQHQQKQQQRRRRSRIGDTSSVLSGIPTFLNHLSQIRITHLSAHPRGHHVLLISEEGLLFSYGSNECGQLGLGRFHKKGNNRRGNNTKSEVDSTRFRVTIPSIVTPLLENGGKTVNCAAGVDYSLVVVRTEGSRLANRRYNKVSPSSPSGKNNDCITHHQMYGFGNNEHMKLGLLDPDSIGKRRNKNAGGSNFTTPRRNNRGDAAADLDSPPSSSVLSCFSTPDSIATVESESDEIAHKLANYVFLPRRVALHCRVYSKKGTHSAMKQSQSDLPPLEYGIFKVAASCDHSAALVRRPSGAVELYSWGRGGSFGHSTSQAAQEDDIPSPRRWECVPLPSLIQQKDEVVQNLTVATPTLVTTLSSLHENQSSAKSGAPPRTPSPRKESRQRSPGKAMSNTDNLEGTKSLLHPTENLVDIALGPSCTHAVTSSGRWFAFGNSQDGLLGLGPYTTTANVPTEVKFAGSGTIASVSIGEKHAVAVSREGVAYTWGRCQHGIRTSTGDIETLSSPQPISFPDRIQPNKRKTVEDALIRHMGLGASAKNTTSDDVDGVVYAHAGRDLSVFVLESGSVLTCGQKSGRLGQGDDVSMNVNSPRQMFGGLQLWRNDCNIDITSLEA